MTTLEQTKFERLFSTPIARYRIAEHEALNCALLELGAGMRARSTGLKKSNRGGWHSEGNLFEHDAPSIRALQDASTRAVLAATRKITTKVDPATLRLQLFAWMNANPKGGYNAPHTHPGAHWSGVYYVSQPDVDVGNSGMIEFLDPRSDLPHWRVLQAPAFRLKKKIRPAPGDLILFPSYLVHWVYPNETEEDRVTIAFNATFRKSKEAGPAVSAGTGATPQKI